MCAWETNNCFAIPSKAILGKSGVARFVSQALAVESGSIFALRKIADITPAVGNGNESE